MGLQQDDVTVGFAGWHTASLSNIVASRPMTSGSSGIRATTIRTTEDVLFVHGRV